MATLPTPRPKTSPRGGRPRRLPVPAPLVALAAWILPGAGYALIGQWARGLTVGLSVLLLFFLGLLIGGVKVVDPPTGYSLGEILQKPWFVGQALTGPVGLGAGYYSTKFITWDADNVVEEVDEAGQKSKRIEHETRRVPLPLSHARSAEIGTLYTAVAGMLNLMTIIDAAYRGAHDEDEAVAGRAAGAGAGGSDTGGAAGAGA